MLTTEEEARKMWCPFARVSDFKGARELTEDSDEEPQLVAALASVIGAPSNRRLITQEDDMCAQFASDAPAYRCISSDCMCWRWSFNEATTPTGYCGLGGQPVIMKEIP